jgi:hypothetical protein
VSGEVRIAASVEPSATVTTRSKAFIFDSVRLPEIRRNAMSATYASTPVMAVCQIFGQLSNIAQLQRTVTSGCAAATRGDSDTRSRLESLHLNSPRDRRESCARRILKFSACRGEISRNATVAHHRGSQSLQRRRTPQIEHLSLTPSTRPGTSTGFR